MTYPSRILFSPVGVDCMDPPSGKGKVKGASGKDGKGSKDDKAIKDSKDDKDSKDGDNEIMRIATDTTGDAESDYDYFVAGPVNPTYTKSAISSKDAAKGTAKTKGASSKDGKGKGTGKSPIGFYVLLNIATPCLTSVAFFSLLQVWTLLSPLLVRAK